MIPKFGGPVAEHRAAYEVFGGDQAPIARVVGGAAVVTQHVVSTCYSYGIVAAHAVMGDVVFLA